MLRKERDLKIVVSKFKYPTATCRFGGPGSSMKKKAIKSTCFWTTAHSYCETN